VIRVFIFPGAVGQSKVFLAAAETTAHISIGKVVQIGYMERTD